MKSFTNHSGISEATSVAFLPATASSELPRSSDESALRLLRDMLRDLATPLGELARRARGAGSGDGGSVVLLTGCQRRVGCSSIALALAAAAAAERPALLIDGDFSQAGLSLELAPRRLSSGWEEMVGTGQELRHMVQMVHEANMLAFLPLGNSPDQAHETLARPEFPEWLNEIRNQYGLIVVDGGWIDQSGASWAPWADAALVVCDAGQAATPDWAPAWDYLEEKGAHVLGVVANRS